LARVLSIILLTSDEDILPQPAKELLDEVLRRNFSDYIF